MRKKNHIVKCLHLTVNGNRYDRLSFYRSQLSYLCIISDNGSHFDIIFSFRRLKCHCCRSSLILWAIVCFLNPRCFGQSQLQSQHYRSGFPPVVPRYCCAACSSYELAPYSDDVTYVPFHYNVYYQCQITQNMLSLSRTICRIHVCCCSICITTTIIHPENTPNKNITLTNKKVKRKKTQRKQNRMYIFGKQKCLFLPCNLV